MGLGISSRLGPYEILAPLGAGGMGEVYRARDTRLGREVAIKVLPEAFANDPDRQARFEREARAVATLSHPNILAIHDYGTQDAVTYAVMELLEGETLRSRLAKGPLSLREAVEIGAAIADGLAAAHTKGIIHRDVKPANLFLTADGRVKILDFGLARIKPLTDSQSETGPYVPPKTDPGTVMGTIAYMSPEQARGEELDGRTDLYSLGVVLYEMVTGALPFQGKTTAVLFDALLHHAPVAPRRLNPSLPIEPELVILKALEKDRDVRYQTAAELRADLKRLKRDLDPGVARASGTTRSATAASPRRWLGGRWLWPAAFVGLVLLIGGTLWFRFFRPDRPLVTPPKQTDAEAEAPLPPMQTMPFTSFPGRATSPAFSPDGDRIAFVWDGEIGDNVDIYVKVVGPGDPLRLTNHAGDNLAPAWSPDGRQIAFCRADWAAGEFGIFVISALGPPEHKVFSLNRPISSLDWSADGKSLAFAYTDLQEKAFGVFLLSIEDRVVRRVTQPPPGSIDGTPVFSPDGLSLVFVRQGIDPHTASSIYRVRVAGGEPERLTLSDRGIKGLCWTSDSREIVFSENASGERAQLWRMAASGGKALPVAGVGDNVVSPAISRRGHRLAYIKLLDDWNIWRLKISTSEERPAPTKLIYSTQAEDAPEYAPDGKHIAFASNRLGSYEIWVCDSDGRNPQAVTSLGGPSNGSPCWSPDGRRIAFDSLVQGRCGIYVVDADGGPARPITGKEEGAAFLPSWSKDGRWIFFASNRSGGSQIWQVPVQGGTPVQVTHQGGWIPRASQDGKFVYYFHWGEPKTGVSIWRIPADGGQETPVLTLPKGTEWNHWTLGERAIYYIDWEATPRAAIKCFSLETRKTTQLGEIVQERRLRGFGFQPGPRLGVSPDEQWLLYVQYDQSGSDIMLVENFR